MNGCTSFETTQGYIRLAEDTRERFGVVDCYGNSAAFAMDRPPEVGWVPWGTFRLTDGKRSRKYPRGCRVSKELAG
jgi:hypothetical protein